MGKALDAVNERLDSLKAWIQSLEEEVEAGPPHVSITAQTSLRDRYKELRELQIEHAKLVEAEEVGVAEAAAAKHALAEQLSADERNFWFRRFNTTLAIANAGAFTAICAGLAQADQPKLLGPHLALGLSCFASGTVAAGLIPLGRYFELVFFQFGEGEIWPKAASTTASWISTLLVVGASAAFVAGLLQVIGVVSGL